MDWKVFNDDNDILSFLTYEGYYTNQIIDEDEHDNYLNKYLDENSLPKPVVKLEYLYDLKDRFKKSTNCKLNSSTLRFELVNLGSEEKPQNINLALGLSLDERLSFIQVLRRYKDIFFPEVMMK